MQSAEPQDQTATPKPNQAPSTDDKPTVTASPAAAAPSVAAGVPEGATQHNGVPKPAYWLCYPVYASSPAGAPDQADLIPDSAQPPVAAGDAVAATKPPPLSFDEWLKTVGIHLASPIEGRPLLLTAGQTLKNGPIRAI